MIPIALLPHRSAYYNLGRPEVPSLIAGLHKFIGRPDAITCTGKTDGGGAQVHAVLSVQAFCLAFGIPYVHSPFSRLEHSPQRDVIRWEDAFKLGCGFPLASQTPLPIVPADAFARNRLGWGRRCVVSMEHCHAFTDLHPEAFNLVRSRFRQDFFGEGLLDRPDRLNIAIHVRRGDVSASTNSERFTPIEILARRVEHLLNICKAHNPRITVFSEGPASQFELLASLGCELSCDGDAIESVRAMARADILLTAKSSFSYVAGMLTRGLVLYERFWHTPLPDWQPIDDWPLTEGRVRQFLAQRHTNGPT